MDGERLLQLRNRRPNLLGKVHDFLVLYFERSNIHGFPYFALKHLQILEKLFWLILVIVSFTVTITLSLESLDRYKTKSTVVAIERDHYYWNTSLPSVTICPMINRIDRRLFNEYCEKNAITGTDKDEFFEFIESMANASYESFHLIKDYKSIEKLNINPSDYMMLIFNLTLDKTREIDGEQRVRAFRNLDYITCEQVLTEQGICYVSNNYLSPNLSAKYLLTGEHPKPLKNIPFYRDKELYDVITGNLFDGDKSYSIVGFLNDIMIYIHSPYEVMNIAKMKSYAWNSIEYLCSAVEVLPASNLQKDTRIAQRHCRFNSESNLTHYSIFTRGLCLQECRLELVYKLCRCIPHFYPNRMAQPKRVCSYMELKTCVAKHMQYIMEFRTTINNESITVHCNCLQSCVDSNIFINSQKVLEDTTELLGTIGGIVIVRDYPIVRYKRKILFSLTDLFVSIGATASFFTGFCVLGAIEIIYFFTIRLFWHVTGKKITSLDMSTVSH